MKIPALEKLLDYAASGIGATAGPMLARWKARTAADAKRIEAQGKADAKRIEARGKADAKRIEAQGEKDTSTFILEEQTEAKKRFDNASIQGESDISREIQERMEFQQQKELSNINKVVGMAADKLVGKEVEDSDVDHDWTARFFSDVKDVSSEQMQQIWAKILAGEVETPRRTSLRTLSILRDMTQKDAELFSRAVNFAIGSFILRDQEWTKVVPEFPTYNEFLYLSHMGLLETSFGLTVTHTVKDICYLADDKLLYSISRKDGGNEPFDLDFPQHLLTSPGVELSRLVDKKQNQTYLRILAGYLKSKDPSLVLRHAPITGSTAEKTYHGEWTRVEPLTPDEIRDREERPGP